MAATYDVLLPTDKDRLRLLLGDIDMAAPLYVDEAYEAELIAAGSLEGAGWTLARGLVSRFGLMPKSLNIPGDISITWGDRVAIWNELLAAWAGAASGVGSVSSGFGSVAASRETIYRPEYVGEIPRVYWYDEEGYFYGNE
jgi:hypothetical protein